MEKKEVMSTDQKGLCNYNVHLEKHTEHLQDLKTLGYALMVLVSILVFISVMWLLAGYLRKMYKKSVEEKAKKAALQLVELNKKTSQN